LIHGFTQSKASWSSIAEQLGSSHEVVAIDLPDHAGSSGIHATELEHAATLVEEAGGAASYVGYSLGGRVALTLALQSPAVVKRLVLVGATPGIADVNERAARRLADNALADRLDPPDRATPPLSLEEFLKEWLAGPLFAHLDASQANVESRMTNTVSGLARSLRTTGTGTQTPSYERLHELTMPVLLVAGANDVRFSAIATDMAARIGENATTAFIGGSGHAAPFERPDEFCRVVQEFLAST
jgi:2-succinyl-6-hydroxy-2,4-cyclohexadiene-1-carboxylate synthase